MNNQCLTVSYGRVRGIAKNYPYHQPCIYEEYIIQTGENKGKKVWKLVRTAGPARRSLNIVYRDVKNLSKQLNIPFIEGIRQWKEII